MIKKIGNIINIPIPNKMLFIKKEEVKVNNHYNWHDYYVQASNTINKIPPDKIPEKTTLLYKKIDFNLKKKLESIFKLKDISGYYQLLRPENVVMVHSDIYMVDDKKEVYSSFYDYKKVNTNKLNNNDNIILIIFLEDSIIGQGIVYEDQAILSWKAGDVYIITDECALHYTFNCSYWDRYILRFKGFKTESFNKITESYFTINYKDL